MADISAPYNIDQNTIGSSGYIFPRDHTSGVSHTWPSYMISNGSSDYMSTPASSYPNYSRADYFPAILHHISYSSTVWGASYSGWGLAQNTTINFANSNQHQIVTNGHNSTLSFPNGGELYFNSNDNVTVTAPSTLKLTGLHGTTNGSGNPDLFDVAGRGGHVVNAGNGADNITVNSLYNYIYGDNDVDNITQAVDGSNYIDGGSDADNIVIPDDNKWRVDGNDGDDHITVGSGNDCIYGGGDKDTIIAQNNNYIHGGGLGSHSDSNDVIQANNNNHIYGDAGIDSITVHDANTVYGGDGSRNYSSDDKDSIYGNDGNKIYGGKGTDSIVVRHNNRVEGNNDSDGIIAEDYNRILGGGDNDSIIASEYNTVSGGSSTSIADGDDGGNDGFPGWNADSSDTIWGDIGNLIYAGGGADQVTVNYANLVFGGAGNDSVDAKDKDSISGGDGADCIKAGEHAYIDAGPNGPAETDVVDAGFDSKVWGYTGNDSIKVDDTSFVDGGSGDDTILAKDDSTIWGGWDNDSIDASDGNLIYGDDSANSPLGWDNTTHGALGSLSRSDYGNAGSDSIHAFNRNTIYGGYGNDSIAATDFNIVDGGFDNDSLDLQKNNTISGGQGNDTIRASDHNLIYGEENANGTNYTDAAFRSTTNDSIVGGTDNTIYSGYGNDTVIMNDAAKIDAGAGDDSISFGMNSSIVAGTGNDTIVSEAPGSLTAPNGSNGSSIWGGKGLVDKFGHPIHYMDSLGNGTDTVTGRAYTAKSPGVRDIHGHNIYTGADALVTIMDFKFGNDVIHFGTAFEASAVTAFGYGNSTIVPTTDYQIYTAGTDRINVAATISDAANIDMRDEAGKFVMFGNPNGTLKGGFANTLLGGKNDDTIYVGEGDYVYGGLGNDTINLNGYNNWRDHVGLTAEGGTDTISCFQQGWGEGDDVVWYNVPLRKQAVDTDGNLLFDSSHKPIYTGTDINTDAVADLNDANVRVVGDKIVLSQGKAKLILNGVTHGEILIEDGEGVHRTALLGDGYYNDSTRGGQIFIGRKEYSDIVSFEKNNHDLVVDLGMTKRFKDKSAKFYSIEQAIGGSGNNTLVGAKNVRNTLEGGVGTSSIWGGGISADLMVSGTGSATDHYTTFFYGTGDGDDTIEGFRTTERTEAHFKRDILDIHSGDVTSVRKVGTSIVLNMSGRTDRLTIRNAASGLFDQLIEVNVMGKKGAAKVTGANEVVTYDPHAQYYFSNAKAGGTVRNFGDNSRIYLDGRTGDVYKGITNIDVSAGSRLELAGDASNNRIIYRGTGTASLYGGLGNDTMTGSKDGTNRFFFGRSDGNDVITNSTVNDKVMLYDVALEDVVSAKETNGTMRIALKSGARLAIQNFDAKSVHDFTLATGDTWVYNHNATGTGGYWSPKGNYPVQPKA